MREGISKLIFLLVGIIIVVTGIVIFAQISISLYETIRSFFEYVASHFFS